MRFAYSACVALLIQASALAQVCIWDQAHTGSGAVMQASVNGNDWDRRLWDNFTLSTTKAITEIHWRGARDPQIDFSGYSGAIQGFNIRIYANSIANEPDVGNTNGGALRRYSYDQGLTVTATYVGSINTTWFQPTDVYDYTFVLPRSFTATGGVKYWLEIDAFQSGVPSWGFMPGIGDGQHFENFADGTRYRWGSGDLAFSLFAAPEPGGGLILAIAAIALLRRRRA